MATCLAPRVSQAKDGLPVFGGAHLLQVPPANHAQGGQSPPPLRAVRRATTMGRLNGGDSGMDRPESSAWRASAPLSPLANFVGNIGKVVPQEQVGGVDARRIVAAMQDVHPRGDGAVRQLPYDAVCPALLRSGCGEFSISLCRAPAAPSPALVGLADVRFVPKAYRLIFGLRCHCSSHIEHDQCNNVMSLCNANQSPSLPRFHSTARLPF